MMDEYKTIDSFKHCEDTWLYILAVLSCRTCYLAKLSEQIIGGKVDFWAFPDRPNFGKWIANGYRITDTFDGKQQEKYRISGRSGISGISDMIKNSCEWDTIIGQTHSKTFKYKLAQVDRAKAIEAIVNGNPTQFQMEFIPELESGGFIKTENDKKVSLIPFLTQEEEKRFFEIEHRYAKLYEDLFFDIIVKTAKENVVKYPNKISCISPSVFTDPISYHSMEYVYLAAENGFIKLENEKKYPIMFIVKK